MKKNVYISTLATLLLLSGCALPGQQEATPSSNEGQHIQIGMPEDSVDFDLEDSSDPEFTAQEGADTDKGTGTLYTVVGDYAYALDPDTLQPTGQALDPITHEPVDDSYNDDDYDDDYYTPGEVTGISGITDVYDDSTSTADVEDVDDVEDAEGGISIGLNNSTTVNSVVQSLMSSPSSSSSSTATAPTPENKYPNTGIFLEDD